MTILEFTPPIRRNYLEEATIKVLKGEKIKKKIRYRRRVNNRQKLYKKKGRRK